MGQLYLRGDQNQKLTIPQIDGNFTFLRDEINATKEVDYEELNGNINLFDCFTEIVSTDDESMDEKILYIKTLPPNFTDNSPINIKAYFTTGANDNDKTIRLKLSGQTIFDSSIDTDDTAPNAQKVSIDIQLVRTSSSTAVVTGLALIGQNNYIILSNLSELDWEGDQDFEITGQNGENNAEPELLISPMNGSPFISLSYVYILESKKPTTKGIRGLYVNDFDEIVGNTASENELFTFCQIRGFNHIYLYGLTGILDSSDTREDLEIFITAAKSRGLIVGGIGGSQKRLVSPTESDYSRLWYNNTRSLATQRFNRINLENEFWNYVTAPVESGDNETFATYSTWLTNINTALNGTPYGFDVYIGKIRDGKTSSPHYQDATWVPDTEVATALIQKTKRILLAMYIESDDFKSPEWGLNKIDDRLVLLANAAAQQNKTIEIVIIFAGGTTSPDSVNDGINMGDYFKNNTFVSAWQKVLQGFASWGTLWGTDTAQNKNRLKFVGYFVYGYTDIKGLTYYWP